MAVGMFKLSNQRRELLYRIFITFCLLQVIFGSSMTGSSLYIVIAISPILHTERAEVNFVFVVTGIYGTHVIFHWIVGIRIGHKCLKQAGKKSTNKLLILWICVGSNTVLNLLIISHFARKINKHITKSIRQSIVTGMSQYLSDIKWKQTIDKLQYNNECCGVKDYTDWHNTEWLTKYHVDVKSETVKQLRVNEKTLTLPITPWSCCRLDFPMQCLHDPLQQTLYAHIWIDDITIVKDSVYNKGCLEGLWKPVSSVINAFITLSTAVFILHVITFCIIRILYTSSRNAVLLGDSEGLAPGWIFGRGDCGYKGGKSLPEIMGLPVPEETTPEPSPRASKIKFSRFLPKKLKGKFKKSNEIGTPTADNEYTLVPTQDTDTTDIIPPGDYSNFNPQKQSSLIGTNVTYEEESGGPGSMEEELKRLQQ